MKGVNIGVDYYEPTEEQKQAFAKCAMKTHYSKIIYKEVETGYQIYCPQCCNEDIVTKETFKQIRASHLCPFCFRDISATTSNTKHSGRQFLSMEIGKKTFGYVVNYNFELGKPFEVNMTQIYFGCGPESYHRLVNIGYLGSCLTFDGGKKEWKMDDRAYYSAYYGVTYSQYERFLYDLDYVLNHWDNKTTKKQLLEKIGKDIVKSNQKKIAIDNLLGRHQILGMVVFDINDVDTLMKYNSYFRKNHTHLHDFIEHGITLNRFYLEYLAKNKINLGEYYTFLHNLDTLKFKWEKPKDFKHRYETVEKMVEAEKDKEIDKKIKRRFKKLPSYSKKNVEIKPFETAYEIRKCGKELHNCIGGYVSRYAEKTTDIYHLDLDGAIKVAIEINQSTLKQAYGNNNSTCPADLMKHIKKFCKTNNIALGRYA